MKKDPLQVLFLAAEADPFVKIGGLGDVAGSLPYALIKAGIDTRLALPLHGSLQQQDLPLQQIARYDIDHQDGKLEAVVFMAEIDGLIAVSYTHLTLPTTIGWCRSRGGPGH